MHRKKLMGNQSRWKAVMMFLLMFSMLLLPVRVLAAVPFVLTTNGISHIGWMFRNSSNDNRTVDGSNWYTVSGSAAHGGTDYYADDWNWSSYDSDCGKDVLAPISGNVLFKGWGTNASGTSNGYGYQVIIQSDDNNNFAWRGTHLQSGSLTTATRVNIGDYIGKIGKSGLSSGSYCHLHSVLYKNIYSTTVYGGSAIDIMRTRGGVIGYTSGSANTTFATPFYNDGIKNNGETSACANYSASGIVLFESAQCNGTTRQFTSTGFRNLTDHSFNDAAKSIYVQPGWSVKVWEHTNREGASRCISWTMWDLSVDRYDNGALIVSNGQATISSIEVFNNGSCTGQTQSACATYSATGIVLFSQSQCNGSTKQFTTAGFRNLTDYAFNDVTKSIYVQSGKSVRIWEHSNRGGATRCVSGTMWDLPIDRYDNGAQIVVNGVSTVSSIEVFNNSTCTPPTQSACATYSANGIVLFSNAQCSGTTRQFTTLGIRNLTDFSFNDTTRSIYVKPGWSVKVWRDINRTGSSRCISGTMWDLSVDRYTDGTLIVANNQSTISSIRVFQKPNCVL